MNEPMEIEITPATIRIVVEAVQEWEQSEEYQIEVFAKRLCLQLAALGLPPADEIKRLRARVEELELQIDAYEHEAKYPR